MKRRVFWAAVAALALSAAAGADETMQPKQKRLYIGTYTMDGKRLSEHDGGPLRAVLDPYLGFRFDPKQSYPGIEINSYGLRGPEPAAEKTKPRVIVLGGSVAFGLGVGDDETFAAHLGRELGAEALNAGVNGYASKQSMVYLLTRLVDLEPDLVIALDGWNDFSMIYENDWMIESPAYAQVHNVVEKALAKPWKKPANSWIGHERARTNAMDVEDRMPDITANYVRNHLKIDRMGRGFGYRFLTVFQPGYPVSNEFYAAFRAGAANELKKRDQELLDLSGPPLSETLKPGDFIEGVHMSNEGNLAIAKIVAAAVRERGLLGADKMNA